MPMRHRLLQQPLLLVVAAGALLAGCSAERLTVAPPSPSTHTAPQRVTIATGDVLYILDGKVLARAMSDTLALIPKEIRALAPEDVKQIEVIKGEAARKLYGAAGENGVVLITTKHRD
jgi:TonB-dependent SusC/RagA subfamily outer membrane receptor